MANASSHEEGLQWPFTVLVQDGSIQWYVALSHHPTFIWICSLIFLNSIINTFLLFFSNKAEVYMKNATALIIHNLQSVFTEIFVFVPHILHDLQLAVSGFLLQRILIQYLPVGITLAVFWLASNLTPCPNAVCASMLRL